MTNRGSRRNYNDIVELDDVYSLSVTCENMNSNATGNAGSKQVKFLKQINRIRLSLKVLIRVMAFVQHLFIIIHNYSICGAHFRL